MGHLFTITFIVWGNTICIYERIMSSLAIYLLCLSIPIVGVGTDSTLYAQKVGETIWGDFNGDGKKESASVKLIKKGHGNPVEDGVPSEYAIRFSDKKLKDIKIGCCDSRLINEGDLNNDGRDDLSVFQEPMNGCTYSMFTYSLKGSTWKKIIPLFLIPTACDYFTDKQLQDRIFLENKSLYKYEEDFSGENWRLVKIKINLR